jgi:hypothetical protein
MDQVKVKNTETGKSVDADVIKRSDKSLRVVIVGTTIVINLSRTDVRRPYVGQLNGREYTSAG